MNYRTTVTVQPQVTTVQAPYVEIDQWGNAIVKYEPLELTSFNVTLPTGQHYPGRGKHEVSK